MIGIWLRTMIWAAYMVCFNQFWYHRRLSVGDSTGALNWTTKLHYTPKLKTDRSANQKPSLKEVSFDRCDLC